MIDLQMEKYENKNVLKINTLCWFYEKNTLYLNGVGFVPFKGPIKSPNGEPISKRYTSKNNGVD